MNPAAALQSSFYIIGGTVSRDAACYVTRVADEELFEGLRLGRFCYVLTARQMRKSSLMVRTAARLRDDGAGVAVLDLTAIGQNLTPEQWYGGLLVQMGQQLELEDELERFWSSRTKLGPLQRWVQALRQEVLPRYTGRVVVFIDEIDAVRSLPFSTDELFAAIRELYNSRTVDPELQRLAFCLLGVATPSDLIRDTRTTPFNIGQRIELHDFTRGEAGQLARGLNRTEPVAQALLDRIFYWTGGHPYLTQRLCRAVAEDATVTSAGGVDETCEALFLSTRARERDDNLLFVRERMLRSEVDLPSLLTLYARVRQGKPVADDETNPLISVLRLSGIARVEAGRLRVRNQIYARALDARWVAASMPDAELQRQRAAYRRGLLRATAIAAVVIVAIALLAMEAARQRSRAEQETRAQRRLLYAADMNLVSQAWGNAEIARMEELLERHWPQPGEEDLRSFEWYYAWRLANSSLVTVRDGGWAVAFSPDGTLLATDSPGDQSVKLRDRATGREIAALSAGKVNHLVFSRDGKYLAAAGGDSDSVVTLWDVKSLRQAAVLVGHADHVSRVAFSPDSKLLASASFDRTAKVWELASFREQVTLRGHTSGVTAVDFSPDGKLVAASSEDIPARIWDVATGRQISTFGEPRKEGIITGWLVAFSPDGTLATGGVRPRDVDLWNIAAKRKVTISEGIGAALSVAFSPDGRVLAITNFDRVTRLYEVASGRLINTFKGHGTPVNAVAFSPDGQVVATAGMGEAVRLWDVRTSQSFELMQAHESHLSAVAYSPDGRYLATAGFDAKVVLWDAKSGQKVQTFTRPPIRLVSLAFSPDGGLLAAGSDDGFVRLLEVPSGREIMAVRVKITRMFQEMNIYGAFAAFSPDSRRLATGNTEGTVSLWDVAARQQIGVLNQPNRPIYSAAFSPDGRTLATAGETATLWSIVTKNEPRVLNDQVPFCCIAFSSDGRTIAGAGVDKTIRLWEAETGREVATLKGHTGMIRYLAFSPDGKRVAVAGGDPKFRIWDTATGQEVFSFQGGRNYQAVAFSPDGSMLALGESFGTLSLRRAAMPELVLARTRKESR